MQVGGAEVAHKVAHKVAQGENSVLFKRAKENPHPAEDRMGADF